MDKITDKNESSSPKLVDSNELARYLKLNAALVRRMAKAKRIPALIIKNGSRNYYRFRISEVERALRDIEIT